MTRTKKIQIFSAHCCVSGCIKFLPHASWDQHCWWLLMSSISGGSRGSSLTLAHRASVLSAHLRSKAFHVAAQIYRTPSRFRAECLPMNQCALSTPGRNSIEYKMSMSKSQLINIEKVRVLCSVKNDKNLHVDGIILKSFLHLVAPYWNYHRRKYGMER